MGVQKLGTVVGVVAGCLIALLALSGGTSEVPRTPQGPPGLPTPFLGVAILGSGGSAAAVDAYGSVVEWRAPGPAGPALISTRYKRQRAGSVSPETGIVMRAAAGEEAPAPLWSTAPSQRYPGGGTVLETRARLAGAALQSRDAMAPEQAVWAREVVLRPTQTPRTRKGAVPIPIQLEVSFDFDFGARERRDEPRHQRVETGPEGSFLVRHDDRVVGCRQESEAEPQMTVDDGVVRLSWSTTGVLRVSLLCRSEADANEAQVENPIGSVRAAVERVHAAAMVDARRALAEAVDLAPDAPAWAHHLHQRSVLTLLALSDRTTGAAPAGLRDHWHYIWPRDAATTALALSEAGLKERANTVADFIARLDAEHAARFTRDGRPVDDGRHEQGDSAGWARLARQVRAGTGPGDAPALSWRGQGDYGERDDDRGDYLANAIVAGAPAAEIEAEFAREGLLLREAGGEASFHMPGEAGQALDTAAAWAVRPFPRPALFPLVRRTLLNQARTAGPYGLFPASDWTGRDPWTAATASTAWSLAVLGERQQALRLMRAVNRAATPLGLLPERADIENGLPRSTTPLAWSHAFALLALQELWPPQLHAASGEN